MTVRSAWALLLPVAMTYLLTIGGTVAGVALPIASIAGAAASLATQVFMVLRARPRVHAVKVPMANRAIGAAVLGVGIALPLIFDSNSMRIPIIALLVLPAFWLVLAWSLRDALVSP